MQTCPSTPPLAGLIPTVALAQSFVYTSKVKVQAETRIDWLYPLLRTSPERPPDGLLDGYVSTRQKYELIAPPRVGRNACLYPLLLFVSFRGTSFGWNYRGPTCIRHGVIYAEPLKAGNSTPFSKRVRIVLDVLDDVRRRYPIDPDRTYIAGHSDGGFTANRIALLLPEYFGGVLSSSAPPRFPSEPWRIRRLQDRLSVVMHAGRKEPVGMEIGMVHGPVFERVGIRAAYQVHRNLGHAMPSAGTIEQSFMWMEEGLDERPAMARQFPASSVGGGPTREEWAVAVLAEAKARLDDPKLVASGLEQPEGLRRRWPDLDAATEAKNIVEDYASRDSRPGEESARQERLRITQILAESYETASMRLGSSKMRRAIFAQGAIKNWEVIIADSADDELMAHAKQRLPLLEEIAVNAPGYPPASAPPRGTSDRGSRDDPRISTGAALTITSSCSLADLIDWLKPRLKVDDVEIRVDQHAIDEAGLDTRRRVSLDLSNASVDVVLTTALKPLQLDYDYDGTVVTIRPERKQEM